MTANDGNSGSGGQSNLTWVPQKADMSESLVQHPHFNQQAFGHQVTKKKVWHCNRFCLYRQQFFGSIVLRQDKVT